MTEYHVNLNHLPLFTIFNYFSDFGVFGIGFGQGFKYIGLG